MTHGIHRFGRRWLQAGRHLLPLVLCLSITAAVVRAEEWSLDVNARSLTPGELIVLTVAAPGEPRSVHIALFGKDLTAFKQPDGRWQAITGIDLDRKPGRYAVDIAASGDGHTSRHSQEIVVEPKQFPTRRLRVSPSFVNPSPAQLKRIEADSAFLASAFAISAPTPLWSSPFVRPVPGPANSQFGSRSVFNGEARRPHGGGDFLSPAGTPVKAPNAGRVVCARDLFFTGNTVIVDHGLGVFSMLAHLAELYAHEGDTVIAGQIIGLVGATGRVTGPHLHWAVTVTGARVDPLSVLALLGKEL